MGNGMCNGQYLRVFPRPICLGILEKRELRSYTRNSLSTWQSMMNHDDVFSCRIIWIRHFKNKKRIFAKWTNLFCWPRRTHEKNNQKVRVGTTVELKKEFDRFVLLVGFFGSLRDPPWKACVPKPWTKIPRNITANEPQFTGAGGHPMCWAVLGIGFREKQKTDSKQNAKEQFRTWFLNHRPYMWCMYCIHIITVFIPTILDLFQVTSVGFFYHIDPYGCIYHHFWRICCFAIFVSNQLK